MSFQPKDTLGGRPQDLVSDMEAVGHIRAETDDLILRSVPPCHVEEVTKARDQFLLRLAGSYSWKVKRLREIKK